MFANPSYQNPIPPTMQTLFDQLKREIGKSINAVKIGTIQSFDAALQEVIVKVAQQQVLTIAPDGTRTLADYPLLLKVPVQFPSGGGFTLTFPIAQGDECIILFNDREIDNWLINGPGIAPTTGRVHDLSDGIAIVGIRNNTRALTGVSTTTTQLRTDDGDTYVEVADGIVNIVAPTSINMTAPNVNINASTKVTITAPNTEVSGTIAVDNISSITDSFTVNGTITATGDVIANGVSLHNHVHGGVTTGGGDTGAPI